MAQRISAHLFMLGLLCLWGAKHCKASSSIFSKAKLFAEVWSSLGSKTEIAFPSINLFIACTCSKWVTLKRIGKVQLWRGGVKLQNKMENTTYPFYCYSLFEFKLWFNRASSCDKFNKQNTKWIDVTLFGQLIGF